MARELLIAWLRDAYTLGQAQTKTLEGFLDDFDEHSEIHTEIQQHIADSRNALAQLQQAIADLGGTPASEHANLNNVIGAVQEISTGAFHDERVKDLMAIHATEHYEHITYMALAEAAREIGEDDIADLCERIAETEQAMAEWAEEQLPAVVASCITAAANEE